MKRLINIYNFFATVFLFFFLAITCLHYVNWPNNFSEILSFNATSLSKIIIRILLVLFPLSFLLKLSFLRHYGLLNTKVLHKEIFGFFIYSLLGISAYFHNKTIELLFLPLLAHVCWSLSKKRIYMFLHIINIIFFLFSVLLVILNPSSDIITYRYGIHEIHSMGFSHANSAGMCIFSIILSGFLLFIERKRNRIQTTFFVAICVAITAISFLITKSRSPFIASILLISLCTLYLFNKACTLKIISNSINKTILLLMPLICFTISLLLGKIVNHEPFSSYNFSARFYEGYRAIKEYGLSFYGIAIDNYILDNNYFCILLRSGIIPFICFLIICSLSINKAIREKNVPFIFFLFTIHIYQTMESFIPLFPLLFLEFYYVTCIDTSKQISCFQS